MKRLILIGSLCYLAFSAAPVRAERPQTNDVYSWIAKLGPIVFNQAGGAFLPLPVLQGLKTNKVSPIMQFVMVNNLMTKCTKDIIDKNTPDIRDPFVVAKAKFEYGICRIKKCFQQGMLVLLLPQLRTSAGDDQDQAGASQQGLILAQAFKKDPACDGKGGDGFDPQILALLAK